MKKILTKLLAILNKLLGKNKYLDLVDFWNRYFKIKKINLKKNDLKSNLGCGQRPREGFINIDTKSPADIHLDIRKSLPFEDSSVSYIYSEHLFEHIEYYNLTAYRVLKDWFRILKNQGGKMKMVVPDFKKALNEYIHQNEGYFEPEEINWKAMPKELPITIIDYINYGAYQWGHKYCYDFEKIKAFLEVVGFRNIQRTKFQEGEDSLNRKKFSMYIIAYK